MAHDNHNKLEEHGVQHTVSSQTLIKASISAFLLALVILVSVILPAEYNLDPTGIGQKLGLTALAQTGDSAATITMPSQADGTHEFETIEVTVPAQSGVEFKFAMQQYDKLFYEWLTDGAPIYFDLHGEPEGDTTDYFESYTIATSEQMQGSFTAPFNGSHGWYWKNESDQPVAIMLMVKGQYQIIGLKQ